MDDNLTDLYGKFELVTDAKYAGGSAYVCRKCGKEAHSIEGWFPCQNDFVPMVVWCNECRNRWRLKIEPDSNSSSRGYVGDGSLCGVA